MVSRTSRTHRFAPNAIGEAGGQSRRPGRGHRKPPAATSALPLRRRRPSSRGLDRGPSYAPIRQMPAENPFHVAPDRRGWLGARQRLAMEAILVQHLGQVSDLELTIDPEPVVIILRQKQLGIIGADGLVDFSSIEKARAQRIEVGQPRCGLGGKVPQVIARFIDGHGVGIHQSDLGVVFQKPHHLFEGAGQKPIVVRGAS